MPEGNWKRENVTFICKILQAFWLVSQVREEVPASIPLIFLNNVTIVETGRRGCLTETRGLREVQRKDLRENLVEISGNLSTEGQRKARNLGIRMTSLGVISVRGVKKVKDKTSLVVTKVLGVAIRMDVTARRGNTRRFAVYEFRFDHWQTIRIYVIP